MVQMALSGALLSVSPVQAGIPNQERPALVSAAVVPSGSGRIAAGDGFTCALTTSGGVKCWGHNLFGSLGNGSTTSTGTPVSVLGLTSGATAIASGGFHSCAITSAGGVKCWGYNAQGELGDGSKANSSTPVDVQGLSSGVAAIAVGGFHACAITTGGAVKCWGNGYGPVPASVPGLSSGVTAIAAGAGHTCAITSLGGAKCWGGAIGGALGNGTLSPPYSSTPVNVSGLASGVIAMAAGNGYSCAVNDSGAVKCWGTGEHGDLGNGSMAGSLVPVNVLGLATGVAGISAGDAYHVCALTVGGGVKCWGNNITSELGDGTNTDSAKPVDVIGLASGAVAVAANDTHSCALMADGKVKCWGDNSFGALGTGSSGGILDHPVDSLFSAGQASTGSKAIRPDGRIRLGTHGYPGKTTSFHATYVGNNVYNTTAVGQRATVENFNELEGAFYTFDISIQNDGTRADRFKVKATGAGTAGWTVTYSHGSTNVTSAVVAGTYQTPSLAPGAAYVITARITNAGGNFARLVTIRSAADPAKIDAVRFGYKLGACGC
jgi:alpha-tubulin suppressor-like RCC1 family protein